MQHGSNDWLRKFMGMGPETQAEIDARPVPERSAMELAASLTTAYRRLSPKGGADIVAAKIEEFLQSDHAMLRDGAAIALPTLGHDALPLIPLVCSLFDREGVTPLETSHAASALGNLAKQGLRQSLAGLAKIVEIVEHQDHDTRLSACEALVAMAPLTVHEEGEIGVQDRKTLRSALTALQFAQDDHEATHLNRDGARRAGDAILGALDDRSQIETAMTPVEATTTQTVTPPPAVERNIMQEVIRFESMKESIRMPMLSHPGRPSRSCAP